MSKTKWPKLRQVELEDGSRFWVSKVLADELDRLRAEVERQAEYGRSWKHSYERACEQRDEAIANARLAHQAWLHQYDLAKKRIGELLESNARLHDAAVAESMAEQRACDERDDARAWASIWKQIAKRKRRSANTLGALYEATKRAHYATIADGQKRTVELCQERDEAYARIKKLEAQLKDRRQLVDAYALEIESILKTVEDAGVERDVAYPPSGHVRELATRYNEARVAADRAINDLRTVANLAIGAEEEQAIVDVVQHAAALLMKVKDGDHE